MAKKNHKKHSKAVRKLSKHGPAGAAAIAVASAIATFISSKRFRHILEDALENAVTRSIDKVQRITKRSSQNQGGAPAPA